MSGNIKYWIPKNRYYELKYFCLQYFHFKDLVERKNVSEAIKEGAQKAIYNIESSIQDVNCTFDDILLKAITDGIAYSKFPKDVKMPPEDAFFDAYRKYFYFLSKKKGI